MEARVTNDYRIRELSAEEDAPLQYAALSGAIRELPRWGALLHQLRSQDEVAHEDHLVRVRFTLGGIYCEARGKDVDYKEEVALSYNVISRLPRRYRIKLRKERVAGEGTMVAEDIADELRKWLPESGVPLIMW